MSNGAAAMRAERNIHVRLDPEPHAQSSEQRANDLGPIGTLSREPDVLACVAALVALR